MTLTVVINCVWVVALGYAAAVSDKPWKRAAAVLLSALFGYLICRDMKP